MIVQASLWAIRAFLKQPDDYIACIAEALCGGGDADTTAAMAGAMSGARLGADALPSAYVAAINDQGRWRAADFELLCSQLSDMFGLVR